MGWDEGTSDVDGRRLGWRRRGAGPPLLYLHDAGADTVAAPVFDDLARDHDVIGLDLPGYGRSGPPQGLTDVALMTEVLTGLLDVLDVAPAVVAGTSLGGWFAVELALAAPQRVGGLVLCAAAGLHVPEDYLFALFAGGRAAAGTQHLISQALLGRLPTDDRDAADGPTAIAAATAAPWIADLAAAAATSWHPFTVNPRLLGRLPSVACPTTVLWGERDALIPLRHGRLFAEAVPMAVLDVVAGAGHLVALEQPERFAAAVRGVTARAGR